MYFNFPRKSSYEGRSRLDSLCSRPYSPSIQRSPNIKTCGPVYRKPSHQTAFSDSRMSVLLIFEDFSNVRPLSAAD
ncbi:hypothetical protein L484_005899 [Morus notabilis]|uniref:Uncharacterized protein n=1 Tax=Morus notabilis TaxID=981085 RepID=W9QCC1_9ROSA|nr:hypothetical protein L484_005899 [Morus notabilis]